MSAIEPGIYRNNNWKTDNAELEGALDAFWNVAYTQGHEQRGHDDEEGTAQKAEEELRRVIASQADQINRSIEERDSITQAENARLRAALEDIAATNQIREFMGDDKNDGYGNGGWVVRDGQYAKIARAALSTPTSQP